VKVLVTGATGFVASHLVPSLDDAGHEVYALGHDESRIASGGTPVVADLRDPDVFGSLPQVDAVVHLAQANVPFPDGAADLFAVNTAATAALLEHARRVGAARFVYASSASVYGTGDAVWHEDDALAARDFYSATKVAGERFVQAYDGLLHTAILRLVAPFGPGQRNRMIPRLIESVRERRPVILNDGGRPRMNPIFVDDVVATIHALLAADGNLLLNVAGDDAVTVRDIAQAAGDAVGEEPIFEPSGRESGDIVCDNTRLSALLGERPLTPLAEGVRRTAEVAV
jgi:UDP-glucose 4-epimerase